MKLLRATAAALLAVSTATAARAQSAAGAEAFDFLNLDSSARAVGMGGAYTALANDSNALRYNPAGLSRVKANEATLMQNQYALGVTQQYIATALRSGLGFQFNYVTLGDIPRTTISNPGGTGGRLNVSDTALGAGYGRAVSPDLGVGAGVKYFSESLGDTTATGWALDFGGMYRVPDVRGLTLGAALLNLGPAVKYASAKEKLPTTLRLGGAYALSVAKQDLVLALDVDKTPLDKLRFGVGGETLIDKQYAVRAGFTTRADAGLGIALGLGWRGRQWGGDYAFVPIGDLGVAHRVSLTLRWGGMDDPAQARAPEEGSPEEKLAKANAAMHRGDFVAAKSYLLVGLRALPAGDRRRVRFHERMGSLLLLQKDYRGALNAYAEGVNLAYKDGYSDESVADAYVGIGMCLAVGKNYADAQRSFQKGLALGPSPAAVETAQAQLRELSKRAAVQP